MTRIKSPSILSPWIYFRVSFYFRSFGSSSFLRFWNKPVLNLFQDSEWHWSGHNIITNSVTLILSPWIYFRVSLAILIPSYVSHFLRSRNNPSTEFILSTFDTLSVYSAEGLRTGFGMTAKNHIFLTQLFLRPVLLNYVTLVCLLKFRFLRLIIGSTTRWCFSQFSNSVFPILSLSTSPSFISRGKKKPEKH